MPIIKSVRNLFSRRTPIELNVSPPPMDGDPGQVLLEDAPAPVPAEVDSTTPSDEAHAAAIVRRLAGPGQLLGGPRRRLVRSRHERRGSVLLFAAAFDFDLRRWRDEPRATGELRTRTSGTRRFHWRRSWTSE